MGYAPTYHAVTWTTAELLAEVKREARIPTSSDFTDALILAEADQAIRSLLSEPVVNSLGMSGRWLDYDDVLVSTGFRSGAEYLVPNASASGTISHLDYYSSATAQPVRVQAITAEEATDVTRSDGDEAGAPAFWWFRDNRISVYPVPSAEGSGARVRIYFPRMHPKLVEKGGNTAYVSSVDQSANTLTIDGVPANWPATPYAVDLYSSQSPHGPLVTRLAIPSAAAAVLTYTEPIVGETDLSAADTNTKVSLSGETDCVQLPGSMRKALTARTASFILRQIGHEALANSLWGVSREEIASAEDQMHPRAKGASPVLVNRSSPLRRRSRGGGRGW